MAACAVEEELLVLKSYWRINLISSMNGMADTKFFL